MTEDQGYPGGARIVGQEFVRALPGGYVFTATPIYFGGSSGATPYMWRPSLIEFRLDHGDVTVIEQVTTELLSYGHEPLDSISEHLFAKLGVEYAKQGRSRLADAVHQAEKARAY